MASTATFTSTYTKVDIRRVVDNFAADFSMMAQSTGLRTRENVAETVSDLKIFSEEGLLECVSLILKDSAGNQIRAATYTVSSSATGWNNDRPGGCLWPVTPYGALVVIATLSDYWWRMSDAEKATYRASRGIRNSWARTSEDTSFAHLAASMDRRYSSNGYGWERTSYN